MTERVSLLAFSAGSGRLQQQPLSLLPACHAAPLWQHIEPAAQQEGARSTPALRQPTLGFSSLSCPVQTLDVNHVSALPT